MHHGKWAVGRRPQESEGSWLPVGIAQVCAEFGVSLRAIRLYEKRGLLQPRRINGMRVYSLQDRARLGLILRLKSACGSLQRVEEYLDLYAPRHMTGAECAARARAISSALDELQQKLIHVDEMLAELRVIQLELEARLQDV
ncbi:MAG: MerR family transcriptional regulator [Rubrivivax sp.]|nr:MerR family transcriptional regulator [Rubrivivax sp.]